MNANPTIYQFTAANSGSNPTSFVPIVVPSSCTVYLLKNNGPDTLYMRSDPNDENTEDTMAPGFYEDLTGHGGPSYVTRYSAGQVLYYVKCTGPLLGKFWF